MDKLGGQGGSRVSIIQGDNGELMGRNSCPEVQLLNKDVESRLSGGVLGSRENMEYHGGSQT